MNEFSNIGSANGEYITLNMTMFFQMVLNKLPNYYRVLNLF